MRLFARNKPVVVVVGKVKDNSNSKQVGTTMGNIHSHCLDANEHQKPSAVSSSVVKNECEAPCFRAEPGTTLASPRSRRTWHPGHFRRHSKPSSHEESTSSPSSDPQSPRGSTGGKLRGRTWHSPRRSHHHHHHHHNHHAEQDTSTTGDRHHLDPGKTLHNVSHAVGQFFHCFEQYMIPRSPLKQATTTTTTTKPPAPALRLPRGGVLLRGCSTPEQHHAKIRAALETAAGRRGAQGLRALGLEFRLVPCPEHEAPCWCPNPSDDDDDDDDDEVIPGAAAFRALSEFRIHNNSNNNNNNNNSRETTDSTSQSTSSQRQLVILSSRSDNAADSLRSNDGSFVVGADSGRSFATPSHGDLGTVASLGSTAAPAHPDEEVAATTDCCNGGGGENSTIKLFCNLCTRRLFHVESDTMVDGQNRASFIADGAMYEAVSRLVQEHAQDVMMEEGQLEWITVEESSAAAGEPLRVLMSSDHPLLSDRDNGRPTVLICTGRGKVRAGIFSRQNLICGGLETATALPVVRDAVSRNLNVVIVDPNARGEAQGFVSFSKTCDFLEEHFNVPDDEVSLPASPEPNRPWSTRDLYVLSHSASGGHMVRYFLDKAQSPFLRNIRAVAFTDSTHSIQWCAKSDDRKYLSDKLQSEQCVYFRVAQERGNVMAGDGSAKVRYLHPAGERAQTDSFWQHRFGKIRTMWAGTDEHSMTNWYAHAKIWDHFDFFLYGHKFRRPAPQ